MARNSPDSLFDKSLPLKPDFSFELALKADGLWPVAGLDEAGRGPLAGPVVAAAVIIDENNIFDGLNDSKKLSETKRDLLFKMILGSYHVGIGIGSAKEIDKTDIRKASLSAMRRAYNALPINPKYGLVDGRDIPDGFPTPAKALIKGDGRSLSIAAASIVAKVTRDRIMKNCAVFYPQYGFEKHMGYGTKIHRHAIEEHGPCPIHRKSFRPIRSD